MRFNTLSLHHQYPHITKVTTSRKESKPSHFDFHITGDKNTQKLELTNFPTISKNAPIPPPQSIVNSQQNHILQLKPRQTKSWP